MCSFGYFEVPVQNEAGCVRLRYSVDDGSPCVAELRMIVKYSIGVVHIEIHLDKCNVKTGHRSLCAAEFFCILLRGCGGCFPY